MTCIRHQRQSLPLYWATTFRVDSPSAPPVHVGGHSNWRAAAPTIFVFYFAAIHTNHRQDLTPASTHAQLIQIQKSPDSTHPITFKSSDSNSSFTFNKELRLDSRLRAFGPHALRPSRLTPSRVHTLPHPWFYITYLFRHNTTQYVFLSCAGFNPPDFSFILFFPVALRPTCVMLFRYISSPIAFDRMTLSAHPLSEFRPKSLTHSQEI